ncbi:hypothetical protein [Paenibacillus macerans]|uniref:hypothetical protein n=1 Tax=Paenibacillus macerans TaxID=44252 RepID=UPI003D3196FE
MIDINLLPPKERSASAGRGIPVLLLLVGLGIGTYFGYDYLRVRESAAALLNSIAETEQQQVMLQQELQSLGASGSGSVDGSLIDALALQRPDLKAMLGNLTAPLQAGSKLETVELSGNGLAWTCRFPGLSEASAYSAALRESSGKSGELIRSVKEAPGQGYIGSFQLTPEAGTAETAGDAK